MAATTAPGRSFHQSSTALTLIAFAYANLNNTKRLAGEAAHKLRLCRDTTLARLQDLNISHAGLQIQRDIQRIELEVVPIQLTRRWTGPSVASLGRDLNWVMSTPWASNNKSCCGKPRRRALSIATWEYRDPSMAQRILMLETFPCEESSCGPSLGTQ